MDGFARVNAGDDLAGRVLRRGERRPHLHERLRPMADEATTRNEYEAQAKSALEKIRTQLDELRVQADLAGAPKRATSSRPASRTRCASARARRKRRSTRPRRRAPTRGRRSPHRPSRPSTASAMPSRSWATRCRRPAVPRSRDGRRSARVEQGSRRSAREAPRDQVLTPAASASDHERRNREFWDADADDYQAVHGPQLARLGAGERGRSPSRSSACSVTCGPRRARVRVRRRAVGDRAPATRCAGRRPRSVERAAPTTRDGTERCARRLSDRVRER